MKALFWAAGLDRSGNCQVIAAHEVNLSCYIAHLPTGGGHNDRNEDVELSTKVTPPQA